MQIPRDISLNSIQAQCLCSQKSIFPILRDDAEVVDVAADDLERAIVLPEPVVGDPEAEAMVVVVMVVGGVRGERRERSEKGERGGEERERDKENNEEADVAAATHYRPPIQLAPDFSAAAAAAAADADASLVMPS